MLRSQGIEHGITHIRSLPLVPRIWVLGKVLKRLNHGLILALCGKI